MAYTIRDLRPGDQAAVRALQARSPEAAQWEATAPGLRAVVAEREGTIAGFAVWRALPGGEAELLNLAVDPGLRRRGIATLLLEAAPAPRVWLEVRASNAAAIALYSKLGFRPCGRRRAYYTQPVEDAILMVRDRPTAPAPE